MSAKKPDRAEGLGLRAHSTQHRTLGGARSLFALSSLPLAFVLSGSMFSAPAGTQAVAGADKARPVTGDPGISSMVVMDRTEFRVLRDYAEPGATRRMHSHDATWHVFTLVTGQLRLTIDGESPVDVTPGEVVYLKGGAKHTFTNTGTVAATIVEVFGKAPAPPR